MQFSEPHGRVSITARDAALSAVLEAWAKAGGATVANVESVAGERVTIDIAGVEEREALKTLLHGVADYVLIARHTRDAGASQFGQLLVLNSKGAAASETVNHVPGSAPELISVAPVLMESADEALVEVPPTLSTDPMSREELHDVPFAPAAP